MKFTSADLALPPSSVTGACNGRNGASAVVGQHLAGFRTLANIVDSDISIQSIARAKSSYSHLHLIGMSRNLNHEVFVALTKVKLVGLM
jgi:hypothetical protein